MLLLIELMLMPVSPTNYMTHTIQLAKSVEKQFNDTHRLIDDVHSKVLSIL